MVTEIIKPFIQAINRTKAPYVAQKIDLQAFKSFGHEIKYFEGDVLQIKKGLLETTAHAFSSKPASHSIALENLSIERINESICDSMKIGEGCEAKVYRIMGTDYVIRIPHFTTVNKEGAEINFNISPQDKVNHCVATIGGCQVQKYIEGVSPMGYSEYIRNTFQISNENIRKNEQIKKCVLEKMSTSQMKKYYLQLVDAHRNGMQHDYGGNNSILNLKTGELIAIDFVPGADNSFFNSLMYQLDGHIEYYRTEQNELLKNGLKSLLELVKEGKILPTEITLSSKDLLYEYSRFPRVKDKEYFEFIKKLADSFEKDKSIENINCILNQLV